MKKENKGLGQTNNLNKPLKVMTAGAILAGVVLPTASNFTQNNVADAATVETVTANDIRNIENLFLVNPNGGSTTTPTISANGVDETYRINNTQEGINPNNGQLMDNGMHHNKSFISEYPYAGFQDGYKATTYFVDKAKVDQMSFVVNYTGQAVYNDQPVDVRVTYDNFKYALATAGDGSNLNNFPDQSMFQISDNLFSGIVSNNIESFDMQIELIDANGQPINIQSGAFMTFNSLNGAGYGGKANEFVDYLNEPANTTVYLTDDTAITEQTYNGQPVYAGINENFVDVIGSDSFKKNSVSYTVSGTAPKFKLGVINGGSTWTSISSATLFKTISRAPSKTVNSTTTNDFEQNEVLNFAIPQKVQTLGIDALSRYANWTVTDTLDADGQYVDGSAKLVRTDGSVVDNAGTFNYDPTTRELTFTASQAFLDTMPMTGETYITTFQMKANSTAKVGDVITNTAKSTIDGIDQTTNTTTSTLINTKPTLDVIKTDVPYGSSFDINDYVNGTDINTGDTVTVTSGTIDTSNPGTQTVTVTGTDTNGGTVTQDVTFTIGANPNPNVAPVINANNTSIVEGSTFNPMTGVTATDAEDGDLTSKITTTGTVDTNTPGTYDITYTVTDSDGVETTKTITVTVTAKPNTAPVINASNTTVLEGETFNPMTNVTATDTEDGDLTPNVKVTGTVDTNTPGTYDITYTVTDSDGVETTKTITVTVTAKPNTAPVINASNTTVLEGETFNPMTGVTATDTEDGDLTPNVKVTGTVDTNTPGTYDITYTVTDSDGVEQSKTVTVTVTAKPNTAPVINADNSSIQQGDTFDPMKNVTATDTEDGDLTSKVQVSGTVDTNTPGTYDITYTVTDSKGIVQTKTVTVTVTELPNTAPTLTVDDKVIKEGSTFDPMTGVKAEDKEDGDITKNVIVSGDVDTSKPGVYPITYTITDSDGEQVTKVVNVTVELVNVNPVLTTPDITLTVGDTFDPMTGIKATDREDGDITNNVEVISGIVNTSKAGIYVLDYSVTDANNGTTTSKRIVTVEAQKQAPRIVVNDEYIMQGSSFDPMDNVWAFDKEDGDISKDVKLVSGDVDTATPGKYDLTYSVTDSDGTTTERTVTIEVGKDHSQAIASLENTVKDLQSQIDGLDKRVTDLEGRVDNIEDKLAGLEDRLKSAEERLNALETNDKVQDAKIQELLDRVSTLESQVKELQDKVTVIENQIKDLQTKQAQQEQRLTDLEKKYDGLKKQTDANTEDIAKLKEEITKVKDEIASIQDKISKLNERLTNVESQVSTLINKVDALEKKVIELDSRLTTVEQQVSELTNKVTELEKKYTELKSQVDKNTQEIESLKNEIKLIKERIVVLETKVSTLEDKVGNIEKQIKELQTRVNTLEEKVKTLESKPSVIINNNNNNNNNVGGSKVVSGTNSTTPGDVFDNGAKNPNGDPFKNDVKKGGLLPDTGEEKQNVFAIGLGMLLAGMTVIGTKLGLRRKNQ